ncbi:MAG TPA: asparagine synthase (glutamine-hydrolyzing), partial [Thermoanaerobaculia bacterium]|nr:asparagine synthase (glutamine-hydrolyzing) [Thermoanaerobaculia bacterium]
MCGINGVFAYGQSAAAVDERELLATREKMRHRGPDGEGLYLSDDRRIGLGHRRLSIIDLSPAGAQPMTRGPYTIVFNGEIYNYQSLRDQLEAEGVTFTSHCDTEVLLQLFAREREAMLPRLRGMYAFAIWDQNERRLFLARDPYGIKPLYIADDGSVLRFGSQVRALISGGGVSKRFDPAGAAGFLLRGSVPEPFTMYQAIRSLPAGSYLYAGEGAVSAPAAHFSIAATWRNAFDEQREVSDEERVAAVHDAVLDSVRHHMVADVPVGAFLSAGIDSASVVAFAREAGATGLQTMTLRFSEYRGRINDEAPLAQALAREFGVRHTIRDLTYDQFKQELPRVFDAMDQPTVDGLNSYFISKAAAEIGLKVALSGTGGDELFGGYTSFRDIPRWMPMTSVLSRIPGLGDGVHRLNALLARRSRHISPKMGEIVRHGATYAGAYLVKRGRFLSEELPAVLGREVAEEGLARLDMLGMLEGAVTPDPMTPYARVSTLESSFYLRNQLLRDVDWAS